MRGRLTLFKGTEEYGLGSEYSLKISYEDNSTDEVSVSFAIRNSQETLDKFLKNFNHDISFDSYDLEGFLRSFKAQEDNFKDFFGEKTYSELEAKAKEPLSKET
ncbi:hypothetical protein MHLP_02080 [Candidatus Mycoplasma haematolamae str. Purdue]|uniref:Uncharacterized protein n=1 Tax=Mycoplasma haematolamae (strain Purdue) TaxID=1212765 RepID=I7CFL2_MYCHA|nr:hypothetical protein [Candidatus Mycoplasma haematolamae]AFO51996.1 hypothetical protein MHLP_02080 [Candidatus Mycoplasma haematolamae str. Purdue]